MMQLDELAKHLLALKGVRQSRPQGLVRWTVGGRLLARQLDDEAVVIRSEFERRERLLADHPETFTVRPRFETHMMVVAELPTASPSEVFEALDAAYALQTRPSP